MTQVPISKPLNTTGNSRQAVRKELFDYAMEQGRYYLAHMPRRERRRLAREFSLMPRKEAAKRQYKEMKRKDQEWAAEMEEVMNNVINA